jgi:HD-like signal output (HDOD) protein
MKRILFVDDEPLVLEALERMLHAMRREWDMRFATGGAQALQMLKEIPADIVVSDMRMPKMNGAQFLNEVMQSHPRTVRFILSGFADQEMVLQCVGGTHQYLSKPCDSEMLRAVVGRAVEMDKWLENESLKALVSRLPSIPSLPALYIEVMRDLGSPMTPIEQVGATIARDPGMTAKMLQMVNSAFFGLRRKISNPTEAVLQLGLETVKSLVLGIHIFSQYETKETGPFSPVSLWQHSMFTAGTARRIARLVAPDGFIAEEAFTAGVLHDVGRLVLLANLPADYLDAYERARAAKVPLEEGERLVFGASHAEVGGYLLGLWGLPVPLVEAAVFHHSPGKCANQTFSPLTAVHIANVFEQSTTETPALAPRLDREYLTALGLWDRAEEWRHTPVRDRFEDAA